jgi:hypothetical protein
MFGEGHSESIVQRGLDEALACQDMLERTPLKPSMLTRVISRIAMAIHSMVHRESARETTRDPNSASWHLRPWQE